MASAQTKTPEPPPVQAATSQYDSYIQEQLRKTGSSVRTIGIFGALLVMLIAAVAYLLVLVVLDHWIVPGGLGTGARTIALLAAIAAGLWYFIRQVLPLLVRRINPAYAAYTIERSSPGLKNSLLNFLIFRNDRRGVAAPVYQAIEHQTAQRLSGVPVDAAVDRSGLIKLGYILAALVAVGCLYKVVSPKDPIRSVQRVLAPWADILPPTRVAIIDVEPGHVEVVRGDRLEVTAEIRGLEADEPVMLYYTTDDQQVIEQAISMERPLDGYRHQCLLPESEAGLHDHLRYRIEAGDAISRTYRVEVIAAPTLTVRSVTYDYPEYTGLTRRVEQTGDIDGLAGTRVTIRAEANQPIHNASLDFNYDGRPDLIMKHEGREATASFTLAMADDRLSPKYASYALRFSNEQGRSNQDPVEHRIQVTPDLPPEVSILMPKEPEVEVPLNSMVVIETRAIDPDFKLRAVELHGAVDGEQRFQHKLLEQEQTGQFVHKYRFVPAREGLKVGETVEYWAVARDNKSPEVNAAQSDRQRLVIVESEQPPAGEQPQDGPQDGRQDQPGEGEPQVDGEQPQEDQQDGQQEDGQPQEPQDDGEQSEGEPQQGEGGEGEGEQQPQEGQQGDGGQGEGEQGGQGQAAENAEGAGEQGGQGQQQQGQQQQGDQQQGDQQPGEEGGEGENGQGGASDQPSPDGGQPGEQQGESVANDGSDDGGAFEEFLKEMQERGENADQQPGDAGQQGGDSQAEGAPQDEQQGEPRQGDQAEGQQGEGQDEGEQPGEDPSDERGEPQGGSGDGAQSQPGDAQQQQRGQGEQRPEAKGGDGQQAAGEAGAGQEGQNDAGAPDPQSDPKPSEKQPQPNQGEKSPSEDQPQSPAHGEKESDSDGSQGGDKSGGGEQGGGQKADRPGTGSEGQNTASDQGDGVAEDSGQGETSDRPGDDVEGAQNRGQPGPKGEGQDSAQGEQQPGGRQPGEPADDAAAGQEAGQEGGQPGGESQPDQQTSDQRGQPGDQREDQRPGGQQGGGAPGDPQSEPSQLGGDEANLEYAEKATDLVLENLEDQLAEDKVDREMLDKLGWSKEDLQKFVDRWQRMKQAARRPGSEGERARGELNEALRSLGLGSGRVRREAAQTSDQLRNLRDASRIAPPADYAEQFKAYQKGVSRGQ